MTIPTAPAPANPPSTGQLLQCLLEEMQGMNNRMEMLINMFQGLADQVEAHSAAIATYFQMAAEAAEQAAARAANASAAMNANIGSAGATRATQVVTATSISHGVDTKTGKHTVSVLAGEWQKFGVPVYPEYWARLGFADLEAIPMGTTKWEKDVVIQLTDEGKPKRVIGLAN